MIALFHSGCKTAALAPLLIVLTLSSPLRGAEPASSFGQISIPAPAKPVNAEQCVEDTALMRRDHMKFLLQQRDDTVIQGIRSEKYSLVGCINCHNRADANRATLRYQDPEHFCAGCHLYASVKIDCFECHADRPQDSLQQGSLEIKPAGAAASSPRLTSTTLAQRLARNSHEQ